MRHHDDCLAVFPVQRLQQTENLITCFPVEVACRLIAKQYLRIRDDCARDTDTLLLTA